MINMSTCSQDSYYNTRALYSNCGACNSGNNCGGPTLPGCCPTGYRQTGTSGCGGCRYGPNNGIVGEMYHCTPMEPGTFVGSTFGTIEKLNCCLNQNLPNNTPNGYCQTGWCDGTATCETYMKSYCSGSNLTTAVCLQWCQDPKNVGKCDVALRSYCMDKTYETTPAVCGCALPRNQYPLSTIRTKTGLDVATRCDAKCNSPDAIKLADQQQACNSTICIMEDISINVRGSIKGDVILSQECGSNAINNPGSQGGTTDSNLTGLNKFLKSIGLLSVVNGSKEWYSRQDTTNRVLAVLVLLTLVVSIVFFFLGKLGTTKQAEKQKSETANIIFESPNQSALKTK